MPTNETQDIKDVLFDYGRVGRIGMPEAVFSQGKTFSVLLDLLEKFSTGQPPILFTRLYEDAWLKVPEVLRLKYDYEPVSGTAWAAACPKRRKGSVGVVSAGAADARVAREAFRTLKYLGIHAQRYEDCGISALWRLTERLSQLNEHDAIIVVAGMEGALASVVGGLCPKPIFAVPTSVGYGVCENGKTALAAMLSSCAPGIAALNIDNGYGAACAAARVVNLL